MRPGSLAEARRYNGAAHSAAWMHRGVLLVVRSEHLQRPLSGGFARAHRSQDEGAHCYTERNPGPATRHRFDGRLETQPRARNPRFKAHRRSSQESEQDGTGSAPSHFVVAGRWRSATETRRCARHPCLEAAQPGLIAHYQRSTPPTSLIPWVARLCPPGQMRRRPAGHRRDAAFTQRDQSLETAAYFAAVLEVRIHLPPAASQANFRIARAERRVIFLIAV